MSFILNIESATTVCSVSISKNGELLCFKELDSGYTHAENLHVFIEELLKETRLKITDLHGIAVSRGPGSYTGLRIGVSAAKGLAYALQIPLLSVDTLEVMARHAQSLSTGKKLYCPMIDARRMEVYTRLFDDDLKPLTETEALIVSEDSINRFSSYQSIVFFGEGMNKCKSLLSRLHQATFLDAVFPSARFMCKAAYVKWLDKRFEDCAYFEPFYLKDFLIQTKAP